MPACSSTSPCDGVCITLLGWTLWLAASHSVAALVQRAGLLGSCPVTLVLSVMGSSDDTLPSEPNIVSLLNLSVRMAQIFPSSCPFVTHLRLFCHVREALEAVGGPWSL